MKENHYRRDLFSLMLCILIFSSLTSCTTPENEQNKEKQKTKYKATVYEYSTLSWNELADEILKPHGGIEGFLSKRHKEAVGLPKTIDFMDQSGKDAILAKVPDFIERLNALYKERLFSDNLIKTKDIVDELYIEHYWTEKVSYDKYVPHLELLSCFELVRGKSTKKVDFSNIKKIKIYVPYIYAIQKGNRAFRSIIVRESYPKPRPDYLGEHTPLANVELLDGTSLKEIIKISDRKVKGKTDFGEFETPLSANLRIVFEHMTNDLK